MTDFFISSCKLIMLTICFIYKIYESFYLILVLWMQNAKLIEEIIDNMRAGCRFDDIFRSIRFVMFIYDCQCIK